MLDRSLRSFIESSKKRNTTWTIKSGLLSFCSCWGCVNWPYKDPSPNKDVAYLNHLCNWNTYTLLPLPHGATHLAGHYHLVKGILTEPHRMVETEVKASTDPSEDGGEEDGLSHLKQFFQVLKWRELQLHGPINGLRSREVAKENNNINWVRINKPKDPLNATHFMGCQWACKSSERDNRFT